MSASPASHTAGRTPNGGGPLPPRRLPPKTSSVLVQKKKPIPRRPAGQNGAKAPAGAPRAPPVKKEARDLEAMPFGDLTPSLFAKPPPAGTYTDYPIVMTKKAILEGMRHHVARFASRKPVDPRDPKEFGRPLYLLRRDVRAPMPGTQEWEDMQAEVVKKEEDNAGDAERQAAKEAIKAEIAPSMAKKKAKPIKKKKQEGRTRNDTAEHAAKSQVKYEEALPWHLEDDKQNQIWMGTYEEASSNIWTQLKYEDTPSGPRYIITPVQKWYKFGPKTRLNPEQMKLAEARKIKPEKQSPEPSFFSAFIKAEQKETERQEDERNAMKAGGKGFFRGVQVNENAANYNDENELDFEEDFADDEAPAAIEGEEDAVKEIEARIRKDQLKSNVFGHKTQKDYEADEEFETRMHALLKKQGSKTSKALFKREHNWMYGKDLDDSEDSDSTDTEVEVERERQRKEAEAKEKQAAESGGVKVKSEPGSRNNTPGHRPSKHPDPLHKSAQNLKRPGSPNLSDASGNESTAARKKAKLKNASSRLASNIPSRTHSPAPSSNGGRPVPGTNRSFAAGSGSDTDGGAPRRLKLSSPKSPNGTPGQSRAASRAGSPNPNAPVRVKQEFPKTPEELRQHIPEEGIAMHTLVGKFSTSSTMSKEQIVSMVRQVSTWDKATKLLKPKASAA